MEDGQEGYEAVRQGKSTHRALSLQGWKVAESHPTVGSKVEIDARIVFASFPERPLFSFTDVVLALSCKKPGKAGLIRESPR